MNPFTETESIDIYRLGKKHPAPIPEPEREREFKFETDNMHTKKHPAPIPEPHYKPGAMSTTNYKDEYELVRPDGTSENEKRGTAVRELFGENQLDETVHRLNKEKIRWLYHWFGFNRDPREILIPVEFRLLLSSGLKLTETEEKLLDAINKKIDEMSIEEQAAKANVIRKKWATVLRDHLWNLDEFHPFVDTPQTKNIIQTKYTKLSIVDKIPLEDLPCLGVVRLSSTVPGGIVRSCADGPHNMCQYRFLMDHDGSFWCIYNRICTKKTLKQVLNYQPFEQEIESIDYVRIGE